MLYKYKYTEQRGFKFYWDNQLEGDVYEQDFNFSDGGSEPYSNIVTVIIGKNGTGKSRLMKSVIEELIRLAKTRPGKLMLSSDVRGINRSGISKKLERLYDPEKIIAVSTSPFDKFPLAAHGKYTYLGLRNLESTDLGMAYMTNIFTSLLKSLAKDSDRAEKISRVLEYLGYSSNLTARYNILLSHRKVTNSLLASDPVATFSKYYLSEYWISRNDELKNLLTLDEPLRRRRIEKILEIYSRVVNVFSPGWLEVLLSENGLSSPKDILSNYILDDLIFLADMKLVKLQKITLAKNDGKSFNISNASSGEQSVVMSFLGIASQISDKSLICIDEPEVCLHPEWQEKYLELLIKTFKSFKGCHFLIATHSPLMVSKLADENCYLMKMEDGVATPAAQVNNKSVDFQLANNFGAPGFKNEYLTRELISILTVFGETGKVEDEAREKLKKLLSLKEKICEADPVKKLMEMAQEALKESL